MYRWPLLALVMACAPEALDASQDTAAALPDPAAPAPPFSIALSATNAVSGGPITLSFTGAPAGANVRFAYSMAGVGPGICPVALNGRCLDVRGVASVLPLQAVANGAGAGSLTVTLPGNLGGRYVAFQAVVLGASVKLSNPIGRAIANPGTVVQPTADRDGDGFAPDQGDCADFDPAIRPGVADRVSDGRDTNCDNNDGVDGDRDGSASVGSGGNDCDDTLANINPYALDRCDGVDNDCDGQVDAASWGAACNRSESFTVGGGAVDLLFMVDNSGSMAEEQGRLQAAARTLLDPLVQAHLDVHIGVVTSDADDPNQSGRLVTYGNARWHAPAQGSGYVNWFQGAVNVGTNGSADEKGLLTTGAALVPPLSNGYNAGFLRADSNVHVVFLSDENDSSPMTTQDWLANFDALRGPRQVTMAHAVVAPAGGCATGDDGAKYRDAVAGTGGLVASICDADLTPFASDLADELLALHGQGGQSFVLGAPGDPSSFDVQATVPGLGQVAVTPGQWTWDAATLTLTITGLVLPAGTVVTVAYDV